MHGRGELLDPIELPLKGQHVVIIHPGIHISTAVSSRGILPRRSAFDLRQIERLPRDVWQQSVSNDFEETVCKNHPAIEELIQTLLQEGAWFARMSGSGSAVFGFFDEPVELKSIDPSFFVHWGKVL